MRCGVLTWVLTHLTNQPTAQPTTQPTNSCPLCQTLRGEADGKALLLLDELGTGTDPLEGAALGLALLKRLVNGGAAKRASG